MKAQFSLRSFHDALSRLLKPGTGAWANILIEAYPEGHLTVANYDEGSQVKVRIQAKVEEPGIWYPAMGALASMINARHAQLIKNKDIDIELNTDGVSGSIQISGCHLSAMGNDPASYPKTTPPTGDPHELESAEIIEAISSLIAVSGKSSAPPHLQGINLAVRDGQLCAMATDQIHAAIVQIGPVADSPPCNLSSEGASALLKMIRKTEHTQLWLSPKRFWARSENATLTSNCLAEPFPNIAEILPKYDAYTQHIQIDNDEWVGALQLVGAVADGGHNRVALSLSDNESTISADTKETMISTDISTKLDTGQWKWYGGSTMLADRIRKASGQITLSIPESAAGRPMALRLDAPGYVAWIMGASR